MPDDSVLARLVAEELVKIEQGRPRTTKRWQRAMVRAAASLYGAELPFDLRYPIALALIESGRQRIGQELFAALPDRTIRVTVTEPRFFDLEGKRING